MIGVYRRRYWVMILLTGCTGPEEKIPELTTPIGVEPVGVRIGEGIGADAGVRVPAFAVNSFGAAVPGLTLTFTSSETLGSSSTTPDATGWAFAELYPTARGGYTISVASDVGSADGVGWRVDGVIPDIEYPGFYAGEPDLLLSAGEGIVRIFGGEVWWSAPDGSAAIQVLSVGVTIRHAVAQPIDSDGVTDLLLWTDSDVLLLRGRDGGGLFWGAGFTSESGTIGAAWAGDADGDTQSDLLIAFNDESSARVGWFKGDGQWGFVQEDILEPINHVVVGLSAEDMDGNGTAEITVLSDDGDIQRHARYTEGWMPVSDPYALGLSAGAHLLPSTDLTGDDVPELLPYGPQSGGGQQVWALDFGDSVPTLYRLFPSEPPTTLAVAVGDLSGDNVADLAMIRPEGLVRAFWSGEGSFSLYTTGTLPSAPVLGLGQLTDDEVPDVLLGSDWGVLIPGERIEDDPDTINEDESYPWKPATNSSQSVDLGLAAPPVAVDFSGDGLVDVVTFIDGLGVRAFTGSPEGEDMFGQDIEEQFVAGTSATLSTTAAPVGLAVCDTQVHALVLDGAITRLYRLSLALDGDLTLVGEPVELSGGSYIACGNFPDGDVIVAESTGAIHTVATDGTVSTSQPFTQVDGLAAADTDGDGLDGPVTCDNDGCAVVAADLDGDGRDDVAVVDESGLYVQIGEVSVREAVIGLPSVGDIDADGITDLLVSYGNYLIVYRGTAAGLLPPAVRYLSRTVGGPLLVGDLDGNGLMDLFSRGLDTDSTDSTDWSQILLYFEATGVGTPYVPAPEDTGITDSSGGTG